MEYVKLVNSEASLTSVTPTTDERLAMSSDTLKVKVVLPAVEAVDLGLPSGTKWMTKNIGAESESDYGKYFQWGDTVGYEGDEARVHSVWSTCPFNNGSSKYDETYFIANSGTWLTSDAVLKPEYDAVYQATNGQAKMSTEAQLQELTAKTTSAWVTVNGINGRKYTNKTESSKYIFIPAAGLVYDGSFDRQGSAGEVWSSSLTSNAKFSSLLTFGSSQQGVIDTDRYFGYSVHGVLI